MQKETLENCFEKHLQKDKTTMRPETLYKVVLERPFQIFYFEFFWDLEVTIPRLLLFAYLSFDRFASLINNMTYDLWDISWEWWGDNLNIQLKMGWDSILNSFNVFFQQRKRSWKILISGTAVLVCLFLPISDLLLW